MAHNGLSRWPHSGVTEGGFEGGGVGHLVIGPSHTHAVCVMADENSQPQARGGSHFSGYHLPRYVTLTAA